MDLSAMINNNTQWQDDIIMCFIVALIISVFEQCDEHIDQTDLTPPSRYGIDISDGAAKGCLLRKLICTF